MKYLLDTNIISYFLKGQFPVLQDHMKTIPSNRIAIPTIVLAELEYGARGSRNYMDTMEKIHMFVRAFSDIPFDAEAAVCYGKLRDELKREGIPIGANDMLIAATALAHNCILVTHNTDEFSRVRGLCIEDWTV